MLKGRCLLRHATIRCFHLATLLHFAHNHHFGQALWRLGHTLLEGLDAIACRCLHVTTRLFTGRSVDR
jgi:hypothetical protein